MRWHGGSRVVRGLIVGVAVLLPAGVLAAATVDPRPVTTVAADGRVGAAGLGPGSPLDEEGPAGAVATAAPAPPTVSVVPSTTQPTTSSTKPPTTTTTTAAPKSVATTAVTTLPPGHIPPASSWQEKANGVSATVRIEPAAPVAGQPVTFYIDVWGVDACCDVTLDFGDHSDRFTVNLPRRCEDPSPLRPGALRAVATHTYAKPGPYLAFFQVMDGDICKLPLVPPDPIPLHHVDFEPCIAVGPGNAADLGCAPRPNPFPSLPPPPPPNR